MTKNHWQIFEKDQPITVWQAFPARHTQWAIPDMFVTNYKPMHKDELAKKPTRPFSYTHHSNPQV